MVAKILVVSNEAEDITLIKSALHQHSIVTTDDGSKTLHLLAAHPDVELIILDLCSPDTNRLQVLEALSADNRYKHLPTLILTDPTKPTQEASGLHLGAVDYIRKPLQPDALRVRVSIQLELGRLRQLIGSDRYEQGLTFEILFNQAPSGIAISFSSDPKTSGSPITTIVNKKFEQITGRSQAELDQLGWAQITHPDDLAEDLRNFTALQAGEIPSYVMEKRFIKPDGSSVWVDMVVAPLTLTAAKNCKHICLIQDITQRKMAQMALAKSEHNNAFLLAHLPGMAYRCENDRYWTMEYISAGCLQLTGYTAEQLLHNNEIPYNTVIAPEYRTLLRRKWARVLANQETFEEEYEIITATGERKWVLELGEGVYDANGDTEALEGIILDISDRKIIENQLIYCSEHDVATGLLNRKSLVTQLEKDAWAQTPEKRALISINLGTMHLLSLRHGFQYSQALFMQIAQNLKQYVDEHSQLFCTHEYRLLLYVRHYANKQELLALCQAIAFTVASVLAGERVGGGIGVLEIEAGSKQSIDDLLKDLLITSEKAVNSYDTEVEIRFVDAQLAEQINREETISRELTEIAAGRRTQRLFLQYQPILNLQTNEICGFEALARLNSDAYGAIEPTEFIPLAEKTKLIVPLGYEIARQAFQFLHTLKQNGYDTITISINVSAFQLLKQGFVSQLISMIDHMQVAPENIELEITETVFASNYQEINAILGTLKSYGISVAIDDFGTGYSSLARQRELNASCLKIDRYFIDKLLWLDHESAITGDIIDMAHKLGHCVVAEGVEHIDQLHYLHRHGCDRLQGYFVSKPLDAESALKFLRTRQAHLCCH